MLGVSREWVKKWTGGKDGTRTKASGPDARTKVPKAAEIKIRAERRAGELLQEIEREAGKRTDRTSSKALTRYQDACKKAEIDHQTAANWQAMATIPEPRVQRVRGNPSERAGETA